MTRDTCFLKNKIIAHRGLHDIEKGIPENSIPAFQMAINNNYTIELDVHVLKDGNVVVFHDDDLNRMIGIDKKLKDLSIDEVKQYKLKETEYSIPLLYDVLKLVDGKVPLIIELKHDVKSGVLEKEVVKLLENYKGIYAIKSFNPLSVYYFKKNYPNVIRGQLSTDFKDKKMFILKKYILRKMLFNFITKPDFISYDINALPDKKISKIRKKKIVLGWVIKNKEDYIKAQKYCDNYICENIENYYNKEEV